MGEELWRVSMAYLKNFYDLPTTWSALDVFHDLQARRYYVQNLDNEEASTVDFSQPVPEDAYFMPSALRQRGTLRVPDCRSNAIPVGAAAGCDL
jgi:hypothetical protein